MQPVTGQKIPDGELTVTRLPAQHGRNVFQVVGDVQQWEDNDLIAHCDASAYFGGRVDRTTAGIAIVSVYID